ncbi:MAG: hypothetical protein KKD48_04605 [Nanoarchaeota archaeon]|nr:hypothetical protein [Nanoarchaeota archaeon]
MGVSGYFNYKQSKDWVQLNDEKHDVLNRNIDLSLELEERKSKIEELNEKLSTEQAMNARQYETISFLNNYNDFMIDVTADIEELLLKSDSENLDLINWLYDNSYFYGDDQNTATYMFLDWKNKHERNSDEYDEIIERVYDLVDKINTVEN